jgi:hypothetical protein
MSERVTMQILEISFRDVEKSEAIEELILIMWKRIITGRTYLRNEMIWIMPSYFIGRQSMRILSLQTPILIWQELWESLGKCRRQRQTGKGILA